MSANSQTQTCVPQNGFSHWFSNPTENTTRNRVAVNTRRPGGGSAAGAAMGAMGAVNQLPPHMRQQVNQVVGQAVTNAAINELSSAFARFK